MIASSPPYDDPDWPNFPLAENCSQPTRSLLPRECSPYRSRLNCEWNGYVKSRLCPKSVFQS